MIINGVLMACLKLDFTSNNENNIYFGILISLLMIFIIIQVVLLHLKDVNEDEIASNEDNTLEYIVEINNKKYQVKVKKIIYSNKKNTKKSRK